MNILIVDDNRVNRRVAIRKVADALKMHGLEEHTVIIDEAQNGTEALELVASKRYDLIYMDYNMPGMNGAELTAKIREIEPSKSVIFTCSAELTEKIPLTDFRLKKIFTKQELLAQLVTIESLKQLLNPTSPSSLHSPTAARPGTQSPVVSAQSPRSPSSPQGPKHKLFPPLTHPIPSKSSQDLEALESVTSSSTNTQLPAKL